MKTLDALTKVAIGIVIAGAAFMVSAAIRGWAIVTLWGWFLAPLGLPTIGWMHAYGLSLLWWLFSPQYDSGEVSTAVAIGRVFIAPVTAVCAAWVIRGFM